MRQNKSAAVALQRHGGREKHLDNILQHLPGFVQWATGAVGCSIFWTHGVYWAMHMQRFNAPLFAVGVLLIAVSAHMEVKHNENV